MTAVHAVSRTTSAGFGKRRLSRSVWLLALAAVTGCGDAFDPDGSGGLAIEFSLGQGQAQAPLDGITVQLSGPTSQTVTLQQNGGFFEATVNDLPVGQYTLVAIGTGGGGVTYFGRVTGVQVRADQTTDANVPFEEFVPVAQAIFPGPTTSFTLPVSFGAVSNATQYVVEYDTDAGFPNPVRTDILTATDTRLTVDEVGTYYVRIRAGNAAIPLDDALPSEPVSVEVIADQVAGSDQGSATTISPGTVVDLNVYPANEQNWFAIDLAQDDLIFFAVRTSSLDLPSPLDPVLTLLDDTGVEVGFNDDEGPGNVESRLGGLPIPATGTYSLVVASSGGGSVGHFELELILLGNQLIRLRTALQDPFITAVIASVADTDPAVETAFTHMLEGLLDGDLELIETAVADARTALDAASNPADAEAVGVLRLVVTFAEELIPT